MTALQVDVLVDGSKVIQVMPQNGETEYVLEEQTWAPFSWVPWFTADPWIIAPVFIALASCSWCAPGCAHAPGTGACRP